MRIEETDAGVIEPVTIEEVKDYLGYDPSDGRDDDFFQRNAMAMRQLLEDKMGRIIVSRDFIAYPTSDGSIKLLSPLQTVESIAYTDADGEEQDITEWTVVFPEDADVYGDDAVLTFEAPEDATALQVRFSAGFGTIPENIRTALLDLLKARYERTSVSDALTTARPMIQRYWREHA